MTVYRASLAVVSTLMCGSLVAAHDFGRWGDETLAMIERDFAVPGSRLLAEEVPRDGERPRPAFVWPAGVQLSAYAAAAQLSGVFDAKLAGYVDALEAHWVVHRGVGGYNAAANAPPDRYYDDNAWLVLGLVEAYEATGEQRYLERARQAFAFVMTGEDDRFGGGVYWRENDRSTKNTCSNAPAVVGALRLHQHGGGGDDLEIAKRLYRWTLDNLLDTESGLLNDHIKQDGTIDTRRYTYNTGLMIRAGSLLFAATGDGRYLRDAQNLADASERRWVDPGTRRLTGGAKFAHLLLEALLEFDRVAPDGRWPEVADATGLGLLGSRGKNSERYPAQWSAKKWARPSRALIDQASAARAFYVLAMSRSGKSTPAAARGDSTDGG
ncbi:MAG: glycoside hydrolase family 76 protein [Planctomycetota bacterium]